MSSAIIPGARPEFIKMSPVIRKFERRGMDFFILREERKAQLHKSLNSEEIIRTGTRITRIGRISTDPCAQRLETAPEHGDAKIVCQSRFNNHREHRGHREKQHRSVLSVCSVVDQLHSDSFFQNKFKNEKPQMNTDERRFVSLAPAFYNFFFREQNEGYENYSN